MLLDNTRVQRCLKEFDFNSLFIEELGWDHSNVNFEVPIDSTTNQTPATTYTKTFSLQAVAEKRGMIAFVCKDISASGLTVGTGYIDQQLPDYDTRSKIDRKVAANYYEHLIIYTDATTSSRNNQVWQWVKREVGKPTARREYPFHRDQTGELLIQKLEVLKFSLDEEEALTLPDVTGRVKAAFDTERVTKKFYDRFQKEHAAFLKFIVGLTAQSDREWYASLMLNRLMFIYFIQKKGFLDKDPNYLRTRLQAMRTRFGQDKFYSFYRTFLLCLFHDGLATQVQERTAEVSAIIGQVPYLNGGLFERHDLERNNANLISIPDEAFEAIFNFFDAYNWHLDERPLRADNEVNPDVLGYIFEKYINQKQMGAYYTKEDITDYISKNTIIPFLFDRARELCEIAFRPSAPVWQLLRDNPDFYIYPSIKHGLTQTDLQGQTTLLPIPNHIMVGLQDIALRGDSWNRSAPSEYALPTETWREVVARRQRYNEVRAKMVAGEVTNINDLITLNLNITQFALDAIQNCGGLELLRAFYQAITNVTVLDPTCGSGAFLFAALNILEPLYDACLQRMEIMVDEADSNATRHKLVVDPVADFRSVLTEVGRHPNRRYFILRSIIIRNLYGVDIMEEATEIAKLRLFLKLAAQLEQADQIEPLPDIDFNIRAGNTLVGFVTHDEVKAALTSKMDFDGTLDKVERKAGLIALKFNEFHDLQTRFDLDSHSIATVKADLRAELTALAGTLDGYLASQYDIDHSAITKAADYAARFDQWKQSHQPFHWFVEFYGIMHNGGFDVIIGNPPYIEYSNVKKDYSIKGYDTESCGNLYAYVVERVTKLITLKGKSGMILPHSAFCTDRMASLMKFFRGDKISWISTFDVRPSKLFIGVDQRLAIYLQSINKSNVVFNTKYHRWSEDARLNLFSQINYIETNAKNYSNSFPKLGHAMEQSIWNKIIPRNPLAEDFATTIETELYFHNAPRYWVRAMTFAPFFWNERDGEQLSTQVKLLRFSNSLDAKTVTVILNSNLFYWWFVIVSDCRHLNLREIERFPLALAQISQPQKELLNKFCDQLMSDLKNHSFRKEAFYKATGKVIYDEFYPKLSKSLIDKIDQVLAQHYGFTDEELDFIINYDIKYRMGREADGDGDSED